MQLERNYYIVVVKYNNRQDNDRLMFAKFADAKQCADHIAMAISDDNASSPARFEEDDFGSKLYYHAIHLAAVILQDVNKTFDANGLLQILQKKAEIETGKLAQKVLALNIANATIDLTQ